MIAVYVDTSVFGGCFDDEFEEWSNKLMGEFNLGLKAVVISDLTLKELEGAPQYIRNLTKEIPEEHKECVALRYFVWVAGNQSDPTGVSHGDEILYYFV